MTNYETKCVVSTFVEAPSLTRAQNEIWTRVVGATLALDFPSLGMIRVTDMDRALAKLRATMR